MCRKEALEASEKIPEMKAAGASRVVALVKEDLGNEVEEFRSKFWSGEVYLDETKSFYTALGGGTAHAPYGLASFLAMMMNPFSKGRTKASLAASKHVEGNMTGEGFISGGVYVVRQDGQKAYAFLEEDTGDHAPVEDVIEAVKAAVRGEEFLLAPRAMPGAAAEARRMTWKEWAGRTSGPEGYQSGDITRGILASFTRKGGR
eukprot:TRINITY_DN54228_c0_g1_i1.p1 TRINITY_DN54228_c0_g1~~TRINITY_DN54228_c0_g1_i1.p1  ORF type:complete len:203 (+),score=38.29 TRINITY_DN54228_c0_g1_i1:209-817(+)